MPLDDVDRGQASTGPAQAVPHLLWSLPFAALLLAIAVVPLVPHAHHWWETNGFKLAVGVTLGLIVLGHYAFRGYGYHGAAGWPSVTAVLEHAILRDYVPFMVLLASLYVISGGIQLKEPPVPLVNTGLLATARQWPASSAPRARPWS